MDWEGILGADGADIVDAYDSAVAWGEAMLAKDDEMRFDDELNLLDDDFMRQKKDEAKKKGYSYEKDMTIREMTKYFLNLKGFDEKSSEMLSKKIRESLCNKGFIIKNEDKRWIATTLGDAYGIHDVDRVNKKGENFITLSYGETAQSYIWCCLSKIIEGMSSYKPKSKPENEYIEVTFQGKSIKLNRYYKGHRFSDKEIELLLKEKTINISYIDKKNRKTKTRGKLGIKEYYKNRYIGFLDDNEISGEYEGKIYNLNKNVWASHAITKEEKAKLEQGETIDITISVRGKLKMSKNGKAYFNIIPKND